MAMNKQYGKEYSRKWRLKNPLYFINLQRETRYKVLSHYSNSEQPICKKCGFIDIRGLCLDHINNNAINDRKAGRKAYSLWKYLVDNNFPEGYQVLCANCNQIKEIERRVMERLK